MTRLMCENVDIRRRSVEIGEDEWRFIIGEVGAIAAEVLARTRLQIKQTMPR
ncbi:hypothetical protein SDC9_158364 [bioreactor metagenome]|uniref:Uncharacterized protein n=1 Tax=bioreactor metagenome TaxID=1076179 RepID=A0A645FFA3_9ZZZZ